jgi:hypothetical protein
MTSKIECECPTYLGLCMGELGEIEKGKEIESESEREGGEGWGRDVASIF